MARENTIHRDESLQRSKTDIAITKHQKKKMDKQEEKNLKIYGLPKENTVVDKPPRAKEKPPPTSQGHRPRTQGRVDINVKKCTNNIQVNILEPCLGIIVSMAL